ncbi:MAG: ATP-binding protein [Candidatus Altiarchaeota archaeon]|nr:ATP-binding protein [Candidatus Altiarchaeota archaeon]
MKNRERKKQKVESPSPLIKQVAITGGKGGTGKSTFSIMLASKILDEGGAVVLCDADVECPNDHLILGCKLEDEKPVYLDYPAIDEAKCSRCGLCVKNCRFNALYQIKGGVPQLVSELCTSCGLCWGLCPEGAIGLKTERCGASYVTKVKENLWLVTGKSKPMLESSMAVIKGAKSRAMELAAKVGADQVLVDTAAGTHCNVINTLLGSEMAYVVTEPTPLGGHDSRLIIQLLGRLGIRPELVLNKAGVGKDSIINDLARDLGIKITYRIPYSEEIVKHYSNGSVRDLGMRLE